MKKREELDLTKPHHLGQKLFSFGVLMESLEKEWDRGNAVTSREFYNLAESIAAHNGVKSIRETIADALVNGFMDQRLPFNPLWKATANDVTVDRCLHNAVCLLVWPDAETKIGDRRLNTKLINVKAMLEDLDRIMRGDGRILMMGCITMELLGLHDDIMLVSRMEHYSEFIKWRIINGLNAWFQSAWVKKVYKNWKYLEDNGYPIDSEMCRYPNEWIFKQMQNLVSFKKFQLVDRLDGISLWCYRLVKILELDK